MNHILITNTNKKISDTATSIKFNNTWDVNIDKDEVN